jgi:putative adenylate-forming enzyme
MFRTPIILRQFIRSRQSQARWNTRSTTRAELEKWQEQRVLSFLREIVPKSPYYKRAFSTLDHSEWRKLPVIDKTEMMSCFSEMNTAGIRKEEAFHLALRAERTRDFSATLGTVTVGLSSGTTGNRGLFLVERKEAWAYAGTLLGKILPDLFKGRHRAALFLRSNSNLYEGTRNPFLEFQYFDLTRAMAEHVGSLNRFEPTLIVGPPSVLRELARFSIEGSLRISPTKIYSAAEVLEPLDRRFIEDAFRTRTDQIYQCTEGFIGVSCSHGTIHLNEDLLVIEREAVPSADGRSEYFVPVITDFTRKTQPIIRYRLNDLLLPKKRACPCGSLFTALESISGRSDDILYFGAKAVLPDFIRRALILSSEAIEEYRVIQHHPHELEIQLKCREGEQKSCRTAVGNKIAELCAEFNLEIPVLRFKYYETQSLDGKLRRVYRAFDPFNSVDTVSS